jgi:hypothetical protein
MSIDRIDFDQIAEADLVSLIDTGVREGMTIDYKVATYGNADADVREFLKDISSFANTAGGHLIIGMREAEGVATELVPLVGLDPDGEVRRLENRMRDGITPRILGIRTKAVSLSTGGFAVIIRIPRSWNPPHQVSAKNTNRFFVRNSAGAHEVSIDELRTLFNFGMGIQDRTRAFRLERLAKIAAKGTAIVLADSPGKVIIHIVPFSAFVPRDQVDLSRAYEMSSSLLPIHNAGATARYNFDGVINLAVSPNKNNGYTQLFRNGSVEAVKVGIVAMRDKPIIRSILFRDHIFSVLPSYLDVLQRLDVAPPLVVMLTLDDVYGAILGLPNMEQSGQEALAIQQRTLELPEIVINDYGTRQDYERQMRPAFDALWNAAGLPGYGYFNENGSRRPSD